MATDHDAEGEESAGETGGNVAASLGTMAAGTALVATFLSWPGEPVVPALAVVDGSPVAAAFALVAVLAFSARRHADLDRERAGGVAALASVGVVLVALGRLVGPALGGGSGPSPGWNLAALLLAGGAGAVAAALAFADARGMDDRGVIGRLRGSSSAFLLGLMAFLVSQLVSQLAASPLWAEGRVALAFVVSTAAFGVVLVAFTLWYVRVRDRELSYIDLRRPDRRTALYAVGGVVALFLVGGLVQYLYTQAGLPVAESGIEEFAREIDHPEFLLALVPLSFLAIGPGEELVYRNVIQKSLYDTFEDRTAIVVASVVFVVVHIPQYAQPDPVASVTTLSIVFVLSLVLGYTYYQTENILVPIAIHGAFNAIQFASMYAELTGVSLF